MTQCNIYSQKYSCHQFCKQISVSKFENLFQIKIEKKKDSDPESDIEVDIDSDSEEKPKPKEGWRPEEPIAVPLRKFEPMPKRQKRINLVLLIYYL